LSTSRCFFKNTNVSHSSQPLPYTVHSLVSGASSVQQQHQHNQGQQKQQQQHSSDADPPSLFRVLGPVDAVDCGAAASPAACTATVARSRVPVLLRNTPASEWPAMRKWARLCDGCASCAACLQCERCGEPDLEYLASRIGADAMPAARESTERGARVFVPGQDKDGFLPLELGAEDGSTVVRDVPVDEFMDALTGAARPAGTYRFFSGLLSALQSPELLDDVEPTLPFGLGSDHLATLMWISQRGCVSNTHYDRSANFVVQVAGRKRWLLFPPSEIAVLYTYPSVHRHYHQSRVDIRDPASAERLFPGSSTAEAFEVTLEPGDVLGVSGCFGFFFFFFFFFFCIFFFCNVGPHPIRRPTPFDESSSFSPTLLFSVDLFRRTGCILSRPFLSLWASRW
jgi:hypothetical protein